MEMDLNSTTAERQYGGQPVVDAIDRALLKKQAETTPRNYLGGSFIGGDCERAIQYQYVQAKKDEGREFEPHVLRIFERGHNMEEMAAAWLRLAGFILKTENAEGYQFGFSSCGGKFKGHADGVIVGWTGDGEAPCAFPALWENKALNAKNYAAAKRNGIKKTKPVYYAQVQLYMFQLGLTDNPCVFVIINADTMELHVELISFEPEECQRIIDRAARIIQSTEAGTQLPRTFKDADGFGCRFCDYKNKCWLN
jgi:hypothetical protein